jgi:hypothetical protein
LVVFSAHKETVETVSLSDCLPDTPLKRGVNGRIFMPATAEPIKRLDVLLLFVWEALIPAP